MQINDKYGQDIEVSQEFDEAVRIVATDGKYHILDILLAPSQALKIAQYIIDTVKEMKDDPK